MKYNKIIIIAIIIVVIIICAISIFIMNPNMFNKDFEDNTITPKMSYSLIYITGSSNTCDIEYFVILNSENNIVDTIAKEKWNDKSQLMNEYHKLQEQNNSFKYNIKMDDNILKYNLVFWNGKNKSELTNLVGPLNNLVIKEI